MKATPTGNEPPIRTGRYSFLSPMAKRSITTTGRAISKMRDLSQSVSKRNQKIHSAKSSGTTTNTKRKKTA